jgi:hypothetical protein
VIHREPERGITRLECGDGHHYSHFRARGAGKGVVELLSRPGRSSPWRAISLLWRRMSRSSPGYTRSLDYEPSDLFPNTHHVEAVATLMKA